MIRPPYSIVVNLSGGKDSTAALLMALERGIDIAEIVFFDGGWEFPEMYDHLAELERYIGRKITRLGPPSDRDFMHWLLHAEVIHRSGPNKGKLRRIGNAWPSTQRRWCTRIKVRALDHYVKGLAQRLDFGPIYHLIGFAADECYRGERDNQIAARKAGTRHWFPLIEWDVTEAQALAYCRERGFTWGGLYDHFDRLSCFCCPLQGRVSLRVLRKVRPEFWQQMLDWEDQMDPAQLIRFDHEDSVHRLEEIFAYEESLLTPEKDKAA